MQELTELKKAIRNEYEQRQKENIDRVDKDLTNVLRWSGKKYQGTEEQQKIKLLRHLKRKNEATLKANLAQVERIEQHETTLPNPLIITIEWNKSAMWGYNPVATTNYGFKGSSIGGCGYCKHSTATAEALNSHPYILKKLYEREEERLKLLSNENRTERKDEKDNLSRRVYVGYGSGHGILPSFEGGVGVSSHQRTCEKIGLRMSHISSAKRTDVHIVEVL